MIRRLLLCSLVVALAACGRQEPPAREYTLTGQVIAVKPESSEVLVKHDDIVGFMPAMTMPYKVQDAALLEGTTAGDLFTATLVVKETEAYLSAITKTGTAPLDTPDTVPEVSAFDMVKPGEPVPDVQLVDQDGAPRQLSSYKGRRVVFTFIYTRCPDADFCPLLNTQFAAIQKVVKSTPSLSDVRLISISFDPDFDTPQVLKAHAAAQHADPAVWTFATGDKQAITEFARRFGVTVTADGSPVLVHNLGTAVVDSQGRLAALYSNNQWTPADIVADLETAAAAVN